MIRSHNVFLPAIFLAAFAESSAQDCYVPDDSQLIFFNGALSRVELPLDPAVTCLDLSSADVQVINGIYGETEDCDISRVILPDGLTTIGSVAFNNITLASLDLPQSVRSIGENSFLWQLFDFVELPDSCAEVCVDAFACGELTSFSWPVVELHDFSGFRANRLESLRIPSNVRSLGERAFADNPLKSVEFAEGIDTIGVGAFANVNYMTDIIYPANKHFAINDTAYYTPLPSLSLPNSLTHIAARAFYRLRSLREVHFGDGLVSIGGEAFSFCDTLEAIDFPASLRSIGSQAFYGCRSLRRVHLNEGVAEVGRHAFAGCLLTDTLAIPGSLKTVNKFSFASAFPADGTTLVVFGEGVANIDDYAFYVPLLSSEQPITELQISLPSTLRRIGASAFEGVWLPETELPPVTEAGDSLRWDAYLDGALVQSDIRTVGGLNRTGYTEFSKRSYEATVIPRKTALSKTRRESEVTVYDVNGRKVYQGSRSSAPAIKGLYVVRDREGVSELRRF